MSNKQLLCEVQENYDRILRAFPDFPPFTMEAFQYPLLSAFYELLNDNQYLHKLQQQSWLGGFYTEYGAIMSRQLEQLDA